MVYDIWYMVYGIWYMVYGIWYMVMVYGIWYKIYPRGSGTCMRRMRSKFRCPFSFDWMMFPAESGTFRGEGAAGNFLPP
jgi:hypothetical protein